MRMRACGERRHDLNEFGDAAAVARRHAVHLIHDQRRAVALRVLPVVIFPLLPARARYGCTRRWRISQPGSQQERDADVAVCSSPATVHSHLVHVRSPRARRTQRHGDTHSAGQGKANRPADVAGGAVLASQKRAVALLLGTMKVLPAQGVVRGHAPAASSAHTGGAFKTKSPCTSFCVLPLGTWRRAPLRTPRDQRPSWLCNVLHARTCCAAPSILCTRRIRMIPNTRRIGIEDTD